MHHTKRFPLNKQNAYGALKTRYHVVFLATSLHQKRAFSVKKGVGKIKIILLFITFSLPLLAGCIYRDKSLPYTYLMGQVTLWALFQIIAVPMVHIRTGFHTLFWVYLITAVLLSAFAVSARIKARNPFAKPEITPFLILAILIILFQAGMYVFGQHLDEDDARWIAEANDALVKNTMLLHNPATGEYIGHFAGEMIKDAFSPWAFYVATLSRITGIRPAAMAHTVYAPVLLFLSYCAYWEMGRTLFTAKTERGTFLLAVSVLNLFLAGNVYTQSVFTLTRIWQGKAVVASVMIPAILMLILRIENDNSRKNWLALISASFACCLFSGMGIAIGLLMIAVYGAYTIACNRFRKILFYLLSLIPPLVYGLSYFMLKG